MLGQQQRGEANTPIRRTFLNIKDGKIVKHTSSGGLEEYTFVEGRLERIYQKERTFRGENLLYWYIDLKDDQEDTYSLGFPFTSNVFKSIILSLSSEIGLQAIKKDYTIKIEPYHKDGFNKVKVFARDTKLEWRTSNLPPIEEVSIGDRIYKDSSRRMDFISSLVDMIRESLHRKVS